MPPGVPPGVPLGAPPGVPSLPFGPAGRPSPRCGRLPRAARSSSCILAPFFSRHACISFSKVALIESIFVR
ncbi:MAG: hypothetical protein EBR10_04945 [Planctomycetes bacterium]|nr:hypothetical protein [Planctomycetota bacterium]